MPIPGVPDGPIANASVPDTSAAGFMSGLPDGVGAFLRDPFVSVEKILADTVFPHVGDGQAEPATLPTAHTEPPACPAPPRPALDAS
jgi:hypothetical protein